ncbi:helix-hairpin-helix domain-containing protein [Lichenihabitans psoromatis]|uniref:helix-hairpin-helix domain-containing protein n=1 Tax=Lichenihabitans psoromatis TaxID=2528642 RepID=UPI001A94B7AD|nr:helix-hairpin-helix domain-containing protein [Lichenihabitans psoromatis]
MVLRSATGISIACAALTLCVGVALHAMPPRETASKPWGDLAKAPFPDPVVPARLPRRVEVAALTAPVPSQQHAADVVAPTTSAVQTSSAAIPAAQPVPTQAPAPAPAPTPDAQQISNPTASPGSTVVPWPGQQREQGAPASETVVQAPPADVLAMADPSEVPAADTRKTIDINTASVSALNHLPGNSHIGQAIVNHRPYRSIKELVAKRVLRDSDFARVKSVIRAD